MPLTGIEIYKSLPKTNCGKCGVPTCLSFAMKLAAGKVDLSACPLITTDAQAQLEEALTPPIRLVTIGTGPGAVKAGGETVLFRHEKRLENPPGLALLIRDDMNAAEIDSRLGRFRRLEYQRAGAVLRPELLALECSSGDAARYRNLIQTVIANVPACLLLICPNPAIMEAVLPVCAAQRPLLYTATEATLDHFAALARQWKCPLTVKADSLEALSLMTTRLAQAGVKDIILDPGSRQPRLALADQIRIRTAAINQKQRSLGYPTIVFPGEMTSGPRQETVLAALLVAKYASLIVLSDFTDETLFPLLLARLNLYSDPQRPLATTEGIYEIGNPGPEAPVLVTANFSLTYFIVSSEIEASRVPAFLLVKNTEGLSVLTAWAAGKFMAHGIAAFVKKSGIAERVKHRRIYLPGYIAQESRDMSQELPDWQVAAGPREAAQIPAWLKTGNL